MQPRHTCAPLYTPAPLSLVVCATRVDVAQSLCIFYEHAHTFCVCVVVCVLLLAVLFVACLRAFDSFFI